MCQFNIKLLPTGLKSSFKCVNSWNKVSNNLNQWQIEQISEKSECPKFYNKVINVQPQKLVRNY